MPIIKAKYPKIGNEYCGYQGHGSLYGGNRTSTVTKLETDHVVVHTSED